ncbi:hypothetical protein E4U58_000469 [Claviceps cyperi]|nr:hypothetical protein E4U58_000469 [Claviceps cyperi]
MPSTTPHGTKTCNRCHATKTSDNFIDRRGANGVVRETVACDACHAKRAKSAAQRDACNGDGTSPSSSVPLTPTVERSKRAIDNVQSPQAARTPSRHSRGPPHAESAAVRPRPRTPTRPAIKSAFLTRDDGGLQYHRPGQRSGEFLSQAAARNERERIQRLHRVVRRDRDAQPPSLTPTTSDMYARDHQMVASQSSSAGSRDTRQSRRGPPISRRQPEPATATVYKDIVSHIVSVIAHQAPARFPDPLLMQVDGQGGTGKSFLLISTLVAKLETLRLGCVA